MTGLVVRRSVLVLVLAVLFFILNRAEPRSIEAMRAAGSAGSEVRWTTLGQLDYRTGEMSPELEALVGTEVRVPGFMVPLEKDGKRVTEFLLVPYVGACVHTPAPPPDQLIHVRTRPGESVEVDSWEPVWVRAELQLDPVESVYGAASWAMLARSVEPYEY